MNQRFATQRLARKFNVVIGVVCRITQVLMSQFSLLA
jgi:hypothetical protein